MLETESKHVDLIERKEYRKRYKEFMEKNENYLAEIMKRTTENKMSWGSLIERNAVEHAENIAIKFEDVQLTYKEFNERVNQYAHFFISLGLKKGDIATVLMTNRLELTFIMSALGKIGVISSMINSDFREQSLIHSLNIAPGKVIVIGEECLEAFNQVQSKLHGVNNQKHCFSPDKGEIPCPDGHVDLSGAVQDFPVENPSTTASIKTFDTFAYIFTSGTTGLPKAAPLIHQRLVCGSYIFGTAVGELKTGDTLYCSLPLFHSNPLVMGWGPPFNTGAAFALARKFSVHNFWDDIHKHHATAFCYIGEICRFLFNAPPKPTDAINPVRVIIGNGLRPEIWMPFKKRFNIEKVGEFYAASELGAAFINFLDFNKTAGYCNKPYAIVKYDFESDKVVKGADGFLQKVDLGETGLLLFNNADKTAFGGYTDKEETERKLIHEAFRKGDTWINTGDLVRDQGCQHCQFVDRIGDTFRWKGHNISTTEVESVLNTFDNVLLSCVFGVKIPESDGRAGMAAIVPAVDVKDFDLNGLAEYLRENLAPYAIPIFIRFKSDLSTTSTFKLKKITLKNQGFEIEKYDDPVYVLLPNNSNYSLVTREVNDKIQNCNYKF